MDYHDNRRYPLISDFFADRSLENLMCVVITHFHLDHIGSLPFLTETLGYDGRVYMSAPTKAMGRLLLDDYVTLRSSSNCAGVVITPSMVSNCMKKVKTVMLEEEIDVGFGIRIRCHFAGHVIGAVMVNISFNGESILYTGDFSADADKHIGAARLKNLRPDILITECTYGCKIREDRAARERAFCEKILNAVNRGGRVLIPSFSVGRAQELATVLCDHWRRFHLNVPILLGGHISSLALSQYRFFSTWLHSDGFGSTVDHPLNHSFVQIFNPETHLKCPEPKVIIAPPAILQGGLALKIFKEICEDEKSLVLIPGVCLHGSLASKVMSAKQQKNSSSSNNTHSYSHSHSHGLTTANSEGVVVHLDTPSHQTLLVKCDMQFVSFSSHPDTKGLLRVISSLSPKHTILVHGERPSMLSFKRLLATDLRMNVYAPENGTTVNFLSNKHVKLGPIRGVFKFSLAGCKAFRWSIPFSCAASRKAFLASGVASLKEVCVPPERKRLKLDTGEQAPGKSKDDEEEDLCFYPGMQTTQNAYKKNTQTVSAPPPSTNLHSSSEKTTTARLQFSSSPPNDVLAVSPPLHTPALPLPLSAVSDRFPLSSLWWRNLFEIGDDSDCLSSLHQAEDEALQQGAAGNNREVCLLLISRGRRVVLSPAEIRHAARGEDGRLWFRLFALQLLQRCVPDGEDVFMKEKVQLMIESFENAGRIAEKMRIGNQAGVELTGRLVGGVSTLEGILKELFSCQLTENISANGVKSLLCVFPHLISSRLVTAGGRTDWDWRDSDDILMSLPIHVNHETYANFIMSISGTDRGKLPCRSVLVSHSLPVLPWVIEERVSQEDNNNTRNWLIMCLTLRMSLKGEKFSMKVKKVDFEATGASVFEKIKEKLICF
eukprot:GDKK01043715.1.p1 GENE.GDKK01043715.1~~GDKK01043715.1.p1  ORF type:complete len:931 (-),score=169.39 GDKK01043715.1:61-2721(-)